MLTVSNIPGFNPGISRQKEEILGYILNSKGSTELSLPQPLSLVSIEVSMILVLITVHKYNVSTIYFEFD